MIIGTVSVPPKVCDRQSREWFALLPCQLTDGRWAWFQQVRETREYRDVYWTSFGMPSDLYGQQEHCTRWERLSLEPA